MAEGKGEALDKLRGLADWLSMTDDELRANKPGPGAQAYPALVAWLVPNGTRADVILDFLANLDVWVRTAARSPQRCARPIGRATTRSRSSTSSPARLWTSSSAHWRYWTKVSLRATRP